MGEIVCSDLISDGAADPTDLPEFLDQIDGDVSHFIADEAYDGDQDFNDKEILESNVAKLDKNNNIRDFFYKRLMFPIANEFGKIVGFGGRVLDNSNPKYINSPESDFFKKRNILYNLYNVKQNIRSKKNMLICEGYMDVISLYDKNIKIKIENMFYNIDCQELT